MNKIAQFLDRFFGTVEATNCGASQEEMVDGQAFTYNMHRLAQAHHCLPTNTITAIIHHPDGTTSEVTEYIQTTGIIDSIAVFRAKEAFGMTNVVGAAFGKSKK